MRRGLSILRCFPDVLLADHYQGITENWEAGPIYCSEVTGSLIVHMLGVDPTHVRRLPMDAPVTVQGGFCQNATLSLRTARR